MDQQAEKDKTERVLGLGRRTREDIVKQNQMTALRFQAGVGVGGGRHQTSPVSSLYYVHEDVLCCGQKIAPCPELERRVILWRMPPCLLNQVASLRKDFLLLIFLGVGRTQKDL